MRNSNKKIHKKSTCAYALAALGFCAIGFALGDSPALALAVDLKTVADQIRSNFQGIADLMSGGSYLAGAAFGIQAALKFKAHNENPQQVKLSQPITYALVAGALLSLPTYLTVGSDVLFQNGGTKNTVNGGGVLQ